MISIISLNVNNFGGNTGKPLPGDYRDGDAFDWEAWSGAVYEWRQVNADVIMKNARSIVNLVRDYDVIFLHEVDVNSKSWRYLLSELGKEYRYEVPNGYDKESYKHNLRTITCAFIRKGIDYTYGEENPFGRERSVQLNIKGVEIIEVHMDGGDSDNARKHWDRLREVSDSLKEQKALIIGDMNAYDKGTFRKDILEVMINDFKYIDLWTKQGRSDDTATFSYGKRIDYALATQELYNESNPRQMILNYTIREHLSDHAAVKDNIFGFRTDHCSDPHNH